jgi:carbamoyltransferase
MLLVGNVKRDKIQEVPAITHVDGTARIQTVSREENPIYYDLIDRFARLTGVPVILNTSFNIAGDPIVESPEDAIKCFLNTQLDSLVIDSYLLKK